MKALSTVKLYAGNVTKTRRKADKVAKEVAIYLCVLHKISVAAATEKYSSTARRTKSNDRLTVPQLERSFTLVE